MATASITLTTSPQLIGAGPVLITLEEGPIAKLHIGASLPAASAAVHRLYRDGGRSFLAYNGSDNVYGWKTDPTGERTVKLSYTV